MDAPFGVGYNGAIGILLLTATSNLLTDELFAKYFHFANDINSMSTSHGESLLLCVSIDQWFGFQRKT